MEQKRDKVYRINGYNEDGDNLRKAIQCCILFGGKSHERALEAEVTKDILSRYCWTEQKRNFIVRFIVSLP